MKWHNLFSIFSLGLGLGLIGCEDVLETPITFDAIAVLGESGKVEQVDDTTFRAPVGETITFRFDGDADFITLKYSCFNEAEATLSFDQLVSINPNQDNVRLYISRTPLELKKDDAKMDSAMIRTHDWIDVSHLVNWPKEKDEKTSTTIDLSDYRGEFIVLAWQYDTRLITNKKEPMFTISNMQINYRTVKDKKVFKTTTAASMGFQAFDILAIDDSLSYIGTTPEEKAFGRWDCTFQNEDKTAMMIRQGIMSKTVNEDWVFSRAQYISRGKDDAVKTQMIKNYYLAAEDYRFALSETGEYTLTFEATKANYLHHSQVSKTFKVIVYE